MKINKIAGALVFLAATTLSSTASAAAVTYSVTDILDPVDQVFFFDNPTTPAGFFNDTYNFTLSTLSNTSAAVTNHKLTFGTKKIQDIVGIKMDIFNSDYSILLSSSGDNVSVDGTNVAAGSYHAVITGFGSGTKGGAYQMSIYAEPTAVPVPAAAWLLGSGLIGLVAVARRKEA
jgi:hypothetical protein